MSSLNDKGEGYLANAATGFIEKTLNRMLRQATNKDIPLEEIFKKVNSIDADGIADIISRRQNIIIKYKNF